MRLTAACPGRGHPGCPAPFDTGPGRAAGAGRASAPRPAACLAMPVSCLGLRVASERQAQWRQRRVWASRRRRPRCSTPQAGAASPAQRAVLGEMPERGLLPGHVHTCIPGTEHGPCSCVHGMLSGPPRGGCWRLGQTRTARQSADPPPPLRLLPFREQRGSLRSALPCASVTARQRWPSAASWAEGRDPRRSDTRM